MRRADRPVILLAFADPRRDLGNLKKESSGIADLFYRHDDQVEVVILDHPPLERIIQMFQRYRDRVAVFHYGGHASGFELLLETVSGETQQAGAAGLAEFLSRQRGLHLVFLNGCSTRAQVEDLLAAGVKCVIATNRAIDDAVATYFSHQFYASLTSGADLTTAFHEASGTAQASRGDNTRALYFGGEEDTDHGQPQSLPWELYQADDRATEWNFQDEVRRRRRAIVAGDSRNTASLRQLQVLLNKVKDFWVSGFLARIDDDGSLLAVDRQICHEAVNDPWEAVLESPDRDRQVVAPGERIIDVFDDVNQSLLILGQPGSGKTTTLVELTRELVSRAEQEPDQPVPVVFHLSSWDDRASSLHTWLQGELSDKYQVPRKIGSQWLEQLRLILLLDGLDEVADSERVPCVRAIHAFQDEIGVPGIVVTCRVEEYEALPEELALGGAIGLQPLTDEQIFGFLSEDADRTAALSRILHQHAPLRDLAQSPLMLGIMKDAFIDADTIDEQHFGSLDSCQSYLFNSYTDRMFRQRQKLTSITDREQATGWLQGVAQRMSRRGSTVLLIEDIQPSWLEGRAARCAGSVLTCIVLGTLSGLVATFFWWTHGRISATKLVEAGLAYWITPMFLAWFLLVAWLEQAFPALSTPITPSPRNHARGFGKMAILFVIWGSLTAVAATAAWGSLTTADMTDQNAATTGNAPNLRLAFIAALLMCGTMVTLMIGAFGFNRRAMHSIRSVDLLGFSRRAAAEGTLWGGLAGFCLWLSYLPWASSKIDLVWPVHVSGDNVFLVGFVLLGIEAGAIARGLQPRMLESKTRANEGMRLSLRNALMGGTVTGVTVFVTMLLLCAVVKFNQQPLDVADIIWFAIASGAVAFYGSCVWFGGFEVLKHFTLRAVLAATGQLPWRLVSFLEDATRLNLLQRVGGGYMFLHRLLAEHFAKHTRP